MNKICQACNGECCKTFDYVALDDKEVERMSELGGDVILDGDSYIMDISNGCQFLKNGRCSIYSQRPRACKTWSCTKLSKEFSKEFLKNKPNII